MVMPRPLRQGTGYNTASDCALEPELAPGFITDYGGGIGEHRKGEIPGILERAFFDLEVGEVEGPVRTSAGFHIIKLTKREALGVMPFVEVKDKIIQDLQEEEMQRQAGIWLKERRSRMFIDIRI